MNIANCPYCGEEVRFTVTPKMGEPAFCPACKMPAVVVWLTPVMLEDASHMVAISPEPVGSGRLRRQSHRKRYERDEDDDDFSWDRKRRGFESRRRRQGNRASWSYEDG